MMKSYLINITLLLSVLLLIEAASFGIGTYLKKRGVFYNSPSLDNYEDYTIDRHQTLGWPSKSRIEKFHDAEGSRRIPNYPDPTTPSCVSLYGDSFTWGDQVSDEYAISNVLSDRLKCRVSNFGVSGFGTDQMYLRFSENTDDESPIVILNHFSGDIRRNVTRMRNLMSDSDSQYILLKPRFKLTSSELELIPLPILSKEEAKCWAETPEACISDEYYLPNGPSGISYLSFPYTWSLLKGLKNEHIHAKLARRPVWSYFYEPQHPSQSLQITTAIIEKFCKTAMERSKIPVVTIIANVHDIDYYRKSGRWSYQPLIDSLALKGISVVNTGPPLNDYVGGQNTCILGNESCYGHLTEEGYAVVADSLAQAIRELKATPNSATTME